MVGGQAETEEEGRGRHKKQTGGDNETERRGSSSSQVHVSRILKVRYLKPLSLFVFFFDWHVKGFSSKRIALKAEVLQDWQTERDKKQTEGDNETERGLF